MFKKGLSIVLCVLMVVTLFPAAAGAGDVQQNLPINDGMESTAGISSPSSGSVSLTQDRVSGKYAVKVAAGDEPGQAYVSYTLATSGNFSVSQYSQIKLWVKPGAGAQWVKFFTNGSLITSDKDADGLFKVGQDLVSGKWNQVTLDLTKTSPVITQGKDLSVNTNEFSTWTYDEITSVYSPSSSVDISKMVNTQTEMVNGELRFKPNNGGSFLANTYNTTPTVLTPNSTTLDDFNATVLNSNWTWEVPKAGPTYSLSSRSGWFRLAVPNTTTYDQWTSVNEAPKLKRPVPDGDWSAETKYDLSTYTNGSPFHTGILVYFSPTECYFWGPYTSTNLRLEKSGTGNILNATCASTTGLLRVRKSATTYYFDYKVNEGESWINAGSHVTTTTPQSTGINVKTWGATTVYLDCDYFSFNSFSDSSMQLLPTFSRTSAAYKQDGAQVASNQPRYEAGKFGQAVYIEEGTTNLLTANQSSVETDLTGISGYSPNSSHTLSRDTTTAWTGSASAKIVSNYAGSQGLSINTGVSRTNVNPNTTYTFSVYCKVQAASNRNCCATVFWYDGAGTYISGNSGTQISTGSSWTRLTVTVTSPSNAASCYLDLTGLNMLQNEIMWWDGAQLEQKSYATSWQIGGTAREAETINIPTSGMFTKGNWAVELTFKPTVIQTGRYGFLWDCYIDSNNMYRILVHETGRPYLNVVSGGTHYNIYNTSAPVMQTGVNYSIMACSDGNILRFCVNGSQIGSDLVYTEPIGALPTSMWIGSQSASGQQPNGLIDDLRISSRARTVAEHQSAYNSNQPLPIDQYTTCKMDFDGGLAVGAGNLSPTLPSGKITRISIDLSYTTTSGPLSALQAQRLYLSGVQPTRMAMSGDGSRVYYVKPTDSKVYLLNLVTGENRDIPQITNVPAEIKASYDGTKVFYKVTGSVTYGIREDDLYLYDDSTKTTTFISHWVQDFDIQKDGSAAYLYCSVYFDYYLPPDGGYRYSYRVYYYTPSSAPPGSTCLSGEKTYNAPGILHITIENNQIFYNDSASLYSLTLTPTGWNSKLLATASSNIDTIWANSDAGLIFYKNAQGFYSYQVSSKALRKLDMTATTIIKVTDDNKLIIQDPNYKYQIYDTNTDTARDIRPIDATNNSFDVDNSGTKIAYIATGGLSTYYFNGIQRPERYLFSFDGNNSWHTYKDGAWTVVKTDAVPVEADFTKYGMTIDEVNALDEDDFAALYADGRETLHFDVAVYFASVDPYITPSLKGIKVILNGGENDLGEPVLEKALYTTKQQDFTATKWRKIRRIYPVEIFPKEAEAYYITVKDGVYQTYRNSGWTSFDGQLLNDVEGNWIAITQQGMTAEELRAIPEAGLNTLLPATNFSIIYAMKVQDLSTAGYSSLITVDYVEDLFASSTLVLKITLTDGTLKQFSGLTAEQVEDFMEWLNERQYNRGPIFYCIKTPGTAPVTQVNGFVNYYMIQYVDVDEMG